MRERVAVFDLDGTLTRGDTLVPFLVRARGLAPVLAGLLRAAPALARSLWHRDARDDAKAALIAATLAGRSLDELVPLAERYADEVVRRRLRPSVVADLERHRAQGDRLVIASASPELYVRPIARRLGVEDVIATRLAEIGGRSTGGIDGRNVRGAEKASRVGELAAGAEVWAYGTGPDDAAMLRAATHGVDIGARERSVRPVIVAVAAVALASFLLHREHGYHPSDDGWILAIAWRIASGEIPYRDLIWERPPLTPLLHAVWLLLPEGWQIPAGRLAFYVELAAAAALPAVWAVRAGIVGPGVRSASLVAIGLLVALHNFPPMPWYTVDGILFASAGLTALLFSVSTTGASATRWRALASAGVVLAALAKQSFAPLFVLLVAYATIERARGGTARLAIASLVPGLGLVVLAGLALHSLGALDAALRQLAAASGLVDPMRVGVKVPLATFADGAFVFAVLGATAAAMGAAPASRARGLAVAVVLLTAALPAALTLDASRPYFQRWGAASFWAVAGITAVWLLRARRDPLVRERAALAVGVLAIGWCSALSLGYETPLLGMAAAGVVLDGTLAERPANATEAPAASAVLLVVAILIGAFQLGTPYRDVPRAAQNADLGEVFPRFGRLYTSAANVERFRELRALIDIHATRPGRPFVVMPNYALVYFLTGVRSPAPADWYLDAEIVGEEDRILRDLAAARAVVIISRDPYVVGDRPPLGSCTDPSTQPEDSLLLRRVMARWPLVEATPNFCVRSASP